MKNFKKEKVEQKICERDWKQKDKKYIKELEKFFDIVDNVENERLKLDIIYQMLKCDEVLTKIAEQKMQDKV